MASEEEEREAMAELQRQLESKFDTTRAKTEQQQRNLEREIAELKENVDTQLTELKAGQLSVGTQLTGLKELLEQSLGRVKTLEGEAGAIKTVAARVSS